MTMIQRIVLIFCLLCLPIHRLTPAQAADTGRCHCFKVRRYDPQNRFAADDYLLATSFNSLLATTFAISKRQVVMLKMKAGIAPDDLLIALYLARETGTGLETILSLRKTHQSWGEILTEVWRQEEPPGDAVLPLLASPGKEEEAARLIVTRITADYFAVPRELVSSLQTDDLNGREVVLLLTLGRYSGLSLNELLDQHRRQSRSWSEIAFHLGLSPAQVGKLLLRDRPQQTS